MFLTRSEFLGFAYDLTEKSSIHRRFNKEKRMTEEDFFLALKKKNPDLALRTSEATSLMRATEFDKLQVDRVYELLLKTPRTVRISSFSNI